MQSTKGRIMIYLLSFYIIFGIVLFLFQRSFLYFPTEKTRHRFDQDSMTNEDETLEIIVLNRGQKKAVLYFGGNGESVVLNADAFIKEFPLYTVYLLNYRGYGGSTGRPTEKGIYSDALFLFDKVKKEHSEIAVMGRSLGSAVAVYIASKRDIEKLVIITPFDSIKNIAQNRFLIYPMFLLLKDKFDALSRVKHIKTATLAVIAENDTVIPAKHSFRLVEKFSAKQIIVKTIKGAGHNDISEKIEYYDCLKKFLNNQGEYEN